MAETFRVKAQNDIILIAGPTASGKSRLACKIAQACDGVVINADSMQVYDTLHILTARPDVEEMAGVPHFLYGFVSPSATFSTGLWLEAVAGVLARPDVQGKACVFVGGTGLYFRALLRGLAPVPPVSARVRKKWRQLLQEKGAEVLHAMLGQNDPVMAGRLAPNDGQRIVRALEVLEATGQSLALWQKQQGRPLVDMVSAIKLVLLPERASLVAQINRRFDIMVEKGALEEVRQLRVMQLEPDLPAMKAIGVREFGAYLDGTASRAAAIEKAKAETRRYAKRQMTWLRHQLGEGWQHFSTAEDAFSAWRRGRKTSLAR